ncbi:MAG: Gfo/Idh/MocA family oxidoreductase [Ilumatobacteraceae bacterium]
MALVGAGQMGSAHARIVAESNLADLGIVVDSNAEAATRLAERYWSRASADVDAALQADAVIVAASTAHHLACALPFIEAGIPTFVEKPLAPSLDQVDALIAASVHRDVPLMCGFVERFNAAFRTALDVVDECPTHVMAVRHSPAAPRIQSSVVSDLLLHDLDVALTLFGSDGELRGASGLVPNGAKFVELADALVAFEGGLANLSANRMGQRKVRSLIIHLPRELVEVDLLRQNVTVYRNVSQEMLRTNGGVGYRSSTEIDLPFVRHTAEPLSLQFARFINVVAGRVDHDQERARIRGPHVLAEHIEQTIMGNVVRPAPDTADTDEQADAHAEEQASA